MIGHVPPDPTEFLTTLTNNGLKQLLACPTKQAKAITPEIFRKMYQYVDFSDHEQMVTWVALLYGLHVLLQKSNLVPDSQPTFDPVKQLTRSSVCVAANALLVEVGWAKNLLVRSEILTYPIIPLQDDRICPVFWTIYMLSLVPAGPKHPLFCYYKGHKLTNLTYPKLTAWLKIWVALAGENPNEFTSHSLRRGGCTFLYESNIPAQTIKLVGHWASDAHIKYIDISLNKKIEATQALTKCF